MSLPNIISNLNVNPELLNPFFEGYKLTSMDRENEQPTEIKLPSLVDFQANPNESSNKTLAYSEVRRRSTFNFIQAKLILSHPTDNSQDKSLFFILTSRLELLVIEVFKNGQTNVYKLLKLSLPSCDSEMKSLPTLKLLFVNYLNDKAFLLANTGDSTLHLMEVSCFPLEAKIKSSVQIPSFLEKTNLDFCLLSILDVKAVNVSSSSISFKTALYFKDPNNDLRHFVYILLFEVNIDSENSSTVLQSFEGKEFPTWVYLTSDNEHVSIVAKSPFESNKSKDDMSQLDPPHYHGLGKPQEESALRYTWIQTKEDVTVYFTLSIPIDTKQIQCQLDRESFSIKFLNLSSNSFVFEKEKWFDNINSEDSIWTIENGKWLTLHLEKVNIGTKWSHVFEKDDGVLEALDPNELVLIRENLEKYTNDEGQPLSQRHSLQQPFGDEVEDEDFEGDSFTIYSYDLNLGKLVNACSAGEKFWLCEALPDNNKPNTKFCAQYGVDGLVYEAESLRLIPSHVSTFDALGYVQASKRQRKFITFTQNCSLVIIADFSVNLYLYWNSASSSKPPHLPQSIIALPSTSPIQGLQIAFMEYLVVLTKAEVYVIDLKFYCQLK